MMLRYVSDLEVVLIGYCMWVIWTTHFIASMRCHSDKSRTGFGRCCQYSDLKCRLTLHSSKRKFLENELHLSRCDLII